MYAVIQINKATSAIKMIAEVNTKQEAIDEVEYFKCAYAYTNQFDYDYNEIV